MVGFPGETEEEFEDLYDFVSDMRFDRVGVFQYSHEEDTPAYALEDNMPDELKQNRASQLMTIQQEVSLDKNEDKIGKQFKVIIDRKEGEFYIGRTEFDSPEVDNEVLIPAKNQYSRIGDFAQVEIYDATDFDLYGNIVA